MLQRVALLEFIRPLGLKVPNCEFSQTGDRNQMNNFGGEIRIRIRYFLHQMDSNLKTKTVSTVRTYRWFFISYTGSEARRETRMEEPELEGSHDF